jgi:glycerol-3-phosphate dehydrogenase (NAD(P)+)
VKISVVGAGSWGSALAIHSARCGHEAVLVARDPGVAAAIQARRRHPRRFPDVEFPASVRAVPAVSDVSGSDLVIFALPSAVLRQAARTVRPSAGGAILVSGVKGFEVETGRRMTEVLEEEIGGRPTAALSGPTFADGVLRGDPTAAVVACRDESAARAVQEALSNDEFRLYRSADVPGVELAGGLKNVIAIAAGIVAGLGLGHNTLAALVTRGLAEMARLVGAMGGQARTLLGLAGAGDLFLTCTGPQSRNRSLGEAIGRGADPARAIASSPEVAEGAFACRAAGRLAARAGVEMPIGEAVRRILYEGLSPRTAISELMSRPLKPE